MESTLADTPIARYIRTQRTTLGYSQAELAEKVGCSKDAVSRWEQGTRRPGAEYLFNLSEVFQVDYLELLDRIRYPNAYDDIDETPVTS